MVARRALRRFAKIARPGVSQLSLGELFRSQAKFPAELREIATSLRIETGTEWSRVELCAALLKSLDREYRSFVEEAGAREAIPRRFEENSSSVRGRRVSIEENGGL